MPTSISNLWAPAIWIPAIREKQTTFPSLLNSGVAVMAPVLDAAASGPGTSVNIPSLRDITDQDDEIQVENTAPTTDNVITSGLQVAPVLNRVWKTSSTALAAQVSGADPVDAVTSMLGQSRQKRRQKTLLAILRGLFGTAVAANGAAALSALRLGGTSAEPFDESGLDATSEQLFSPDMFIDAKAILGELADELANGVMWMHPNIKARLEKLDADGFKSGVPSGLSFTITTYRGIPLYTSESLVRAGSTSGYVYDTYIASRGSIGIGEKPQAADVIDTASLQLDTDKGKNNEIIYDRNRFLLHVNGAKWKGTPGGQSATNAELQTTTNWELAWGSAKAVGIVAIRTNG